MLGRSMSDLQRELEECQRLKTAIFEASSDGLAILDANGRFIDVNRAWERIMGMTRAEVLGRTDLEMYRAVGYEGPMMWKKIVPDFAPAAVLMKINGDTVLVAAKDFIYGTCGAIHEALVESELFGYLDGAFTGSLRSGKKGQIELANGGSLFLDEISELPLPSQVKLLKFLDDKVLFPLGGQSP